MVFINYVTFYIDHVEVACQFELFYPRYTTDFFSLNIAILIHFSFDRYFQIC